MVKVFIKKLGKIIFVITYILLVVVSIVGVGLSLVQTKRYNDLTYTYSNEKDNLAQKNNDSNTKVGGLVQNNTELNNQIESLKQQTSSLQAKIDSYQKSGYGEIDGKISGQIISNDPNISQYQNVCAENVNNISLQYCQNVSTISQNFILILPVGNYNIHARVLAKDSKSVLNTYNAYYTEYVKCLNDKPIEQCDTKLSKNIVSVQVKAGEKIANINPSDWNN